MGKINQGILGGVSGKVGNVIGSSWKGIAYIRIMPVSVADPKTGRQLEQRSRLSTIMAFLVSLTGFIRVGFKSFAIRMSAFNACFSYNIMNAIQGTYPNYTVDYPNALLSKGELPPALNPSAISNVVSTIHFTWTDNSTELGASTTDATALVVYNPDKKQSVFFVRDTQRSAGTQTVVVPHSFSGDLVHCYMSFENEAGTIPSNSKYCGAITVA